MSGLNSITLVLVAVAIATVAGDRHQQELKEHYDHLAYIAEFNCHHPQPRVISMHELFPEEETAHKAFFPDVTVLHRCDSSVGCCPSNHHCRPKHTHSVHLPFKVTYLEHIGKHKKGSWIIDYHNFENHTECECVDATVCVPTTVHEETGSSHKPDHQSEHHGESHHKPDHHEPDHHTESSHKTEHHSESHHEPEHHESSQKTEHHSESHHEPDHHSESHKTEHHEEVHREEVHIKESHHEPDHHSESSHKTEQHEESQHEIDHNSGSSSYKPDGDSANSPSYKPEDRPAGGSSSPDTKEEESESSTLPLLVNYVYSSSSTSTSSSTTEKVDGQDISSFFD